MDLSLSLSVPLVPSVRVVKAVNRIFYDMKLRIFMNVNIVYWLLIHLFIFKNVLESFIRLHVLS